MEKFFNLFKKSQCSSIIFAHKWTISNYSRLYSDENCPWKSEICSDDFSPPNNELFKFALHLYPKGIIKSELNNCPTIGVVVRDMPPIYEGKISCRWVVSIEDKNGDKCWTWEMKFNHLCFNGDKIDSDFMKYSELLNCSQYLPNDKLMLYFKIHLQADEPIFNVMTNNKVGWSRFDCENKFTKVEHIWTVENFTDLFKENSVAPYWIQSGKFPEPNKRFCLRLYPNGRREKDNMDIVIWNDSENCTNIHCRISILDANDEKFYIAEGSDKIVSGERKCFKFNRASLLENSIGLMDDNKLRIYCEMSYMIDDSDLANSTQIECKSESITNATKSYIHIINENWTIEKWIRCFRSSKSYKTDSQIFKLIDRRIELFLRLWPNGHIDHTREYLTVDLFNVSRPIIQDITVQYRISLLGADGDKWTRWDGVSAVPKDGRVRKLKFFPTSIMQTQPFINHYMGSSEILIITCELWIIQDGSFETCY